MNKPSESDKPEPKPTRLEEARRIIGTHCGPLNEVERIGFAQVEFFAF